MRIRALARGALGLWLAAVTAVCATLLGAHLLTMPAPPAADPRLARSLAALRGVTARPVALHVLYEGCRCSQRIVDRLVARRALPDVVEAVALVEGAPATASRLVAAGYRVEAVSPEALAARYGVEASPLLAVADGAGRLRYLGGYTERKQSAVIRDLDVLRRASAGEVVAALPLYGCALSARLQAAVDPLGLRR